MADQRKPFDPASPYDALADAARMRIANLGLELMREPSYKALEGQPDQQFEALMIGMMTGLSCIALAHVKKEGHAEARAALRALLPHAVDTARSIVDLPPLEPIQ